MNINECLPFLKEGKYIKRKKSLDNIIFRYHSYNKFSAIDNGFLVRMGSDSNQQVLLESADIFADDWEIYDLVKIDKDKK